MRDMRDIGDTSEPRKQGEKAFLQPHEVAFICGVTPRTVSEWCRTGKLRARRTAGGHYRIPASEAETLLDIEIPDYEEAEAARIRRNYPLHNTLDEAELKSFTDEAEEQTASALPDLRTLFKQEEDVIL